MSGQPDAIVTGLTSTRINAEKNSANEAFKNHVDRVVGRNEDANNQLMGLGAMLDHI